MSATAATRAITRVSRSLGGRTKQEVKDKLEVMHADLSAVIAARTAATWSASRSRTQLRDSLDGRAEKTVTLNRGGLEPFADRIGKNSLARDRPHLFYQLLAYRRRKGEAKGFSWADYGTCSSPPTASWRLLVWCWATSTSTWPRSWPSSPHS